MTLFRSVARWTPLAIVALVLAACSVEVGFDPIVEETVTAVNDTTPSALLTNESVAGSQTLYYRVEVPSSAGDLLYVEVEGDPDLRIALLRSSGATIGVSQSPTYFASSISNLSAASGVGPQAIEVAYACLGPCVATRTSASTYYVRVENRSGSTRTFDLLAYTFDHNDTYEPNDGTSSAVGLSGAGDYSGAIETLDDVDYFVYTGTSTRELDFDAFNANLGLVLQIENGPTLSPGDSNVIQQNERFRVFSDIGRAGPSSTSGYVVTIGSTTSGGGGGVDDTVTATTSPSVLKNDVTIAGGATRTYEVLMPSAQRDLFYAEVDGNGLRVSLQSSSGSTLAVSESNDYFAATAGALGVPAASLSPAEIIALYQCVGPCAAVERSASTYLVVVRNLTTSTQSFDLFAYTFDHNDSFEPNDSLASAEDLPGPDTYGGAIETVGDEDWFVYTGNEIRVLEFDALSTALGLRLEVQGTGAPTLVSGASDVIYPDEQFRVYSTNGRAGPPATSGYYVTIGGISVGAASQR
jgi:hypothetical protein